MIFKLYGCSCHRKYDAQANSVLQNYVYMYKEFNTVYYLLIVTQKISSVVICEYASGSFKRSSCWKS